MAENARYQCNDGNSVRQYVHDAEKELLVSLARIIQGSPPKPEWGADELGGLCFGPTSLAYLFLKVSKARPDLTIESKTAAEWTGAYLAVTRQTQKIVPTQSPEPVCDTLCGIGNEVLALTAVSAAHTGDLAHVHRFLSHIPLLLTNTGSDELVMGRAGTLYLLRVIRTYVPESASLVNPAITQLVECILANGPPWIYHNKEFYGAGHGVIGIITQIILSDPSYAPKVDSSLINLLSVQLPDGHWPKRSDDPDSLVQLCHGAPGVVLSLLSIRSHFPHLHAQIDDAVARGRAITWEQGLLKKEPSMCHGTTGNAFVFPPGSQRDHFLGFGTEEMLEKGEANGWWAMGGSYGFPHSLLFGGGGRAWGWLVRDKEDGTYITYNDI
jgi:hypothetical protein